MELHSVYDTLNYVKNKKTLFCYIIKTQRSFFYQNRASWQLDSVLVRVVIFKKKLVVVCHVSNNYKFA